MTIPTVDIDLDKNMFAIHCVNPYGKAELVKPAVARDKPLALIAALPPYVISAGVSLCAEHPTQAPR